MAREMVKKEEVKKEETKLETKLARKLVEFSEGLDNTTTVRGIRENKKPKFGN